MHSLTCFLSMFLSATLFLQARKKCEIEKPSEGGPKKPRVFTDFHLLLHLPSAFHSLHYFPRTLSPTHTLLNPLFVSRLFNLHLSCSPLCFPTSVTFFLVLSFSLSHLSPSFLGLSLTFYPLSLCLLCYSSIPAHWLCNGT